MNEDEKLVLAILNYLDGRLDQDEVAALRQQIDGWLTRRWRELEELKVIEGGKTRKESKS